MKEKIVCFTGHRPLKLPWGYNETNESCFRFKTDLLQLLSRLINEGSNTFISGMAEGFDMIASELILELKKEFPQIKLIAVIPCKNQEKKWKTSQQERYHKLIEMCDERFVLADVYTSNCMNERNLWMVQHSQICVACWNGVPSGTGNTVKYAMENENKLIIINPNEYD